MNVLVVGSGGREHALCWAIAGSALTDKLVCAPGNAGIAALARCVAVAATDLAGLLTLCRDEAIDFVVVGPEAPLVAGLADRLSAAGIKVFGPSAAAAAIEGSKVYCKELCRRHGIPTAPFRVFADATRARAYVRERGVPLVIKADGLVAGKGVVVAASEDEAVAAIKAMFGGQFGAAGQRVIVEDCLIGEEVSFIALVDGRHCLPLAAAQDHKRVGEGDRGPNTGGMGAYSPAQALTPALQGAVMDRIMRPAVAALAAAGRPFVGALYAGLMLTADGPQVLEFNARFGDPECQVILPRLRSDILPALIGASDGMLASVDLRWRSDAALCVVLASRGYPGNHARGEAIRNLAAAEALPDVLVFHAGTARREGRLVAEGGRVLGVTALAPTLRLAQRQAYAAVDLIDWPGGFCRRDIGWRALAVPER